MFEITRDTDIKILVTTSYRSLAGLPSVPETYLFSKELVAYLETMIAFSVYDRADDPHALVVVVRSPRVRIGRCRPLGRGVSATI